jgi:hypothetical protein
MTRARAKALHDKVNLLLNTLDLEHTLNGSLPHGNIICAVRYKPHGEAAKDKEHERGSMETPEEEVRASGEPAKAGPSTGYSRPPA